MSALGARLAELRLAAMLLTRLPMGRLDPAPTLGAARWAFPLVGACVGLIGWAGFAAALADCDNHVRFNPPQFAVNQQQEVAGAAGRVAED